MASKSVISRRDFLRLSAATGVAATAPAFTRIGSRTDSWARDQKLSNPIIIENANPGTSVWQLTNPADNHQIEGYASLTSVPVGGKIEFFVNTMVRLIP